MKRILSCIILLLISVFGVEAGIKVPVKENLIRPPEIKIEKENYYAVFDYGGLKFKHEIIKHPVPYPQCNAMTLLGDEIMVVGNNPDGYIFFVKPQPFAFKTNHNPIWQTILKGAGHGRH